MNIHKMSHEQQQPILKFNKLFFKDFWQLFKPFWVSKEKNKALGMLILNIGCILIGVWSTVAINQFNRDFYDALGRFDQAAILHTLGRFALLLAVAILVYGYSSYFSMRITILWQRWLTEHFQKNWLSHHNYYHMQITDSGIDNPDQRVSEDLQQFASSTLSLFFGLFQSILTLGSFGYVLWTLSGSFEFSVGSLTLNIPGYLCWAAFLFAVLGTYIIGKMGRKLSGLDYQQQQCNANFRYGLIRLRENGEQIAIIGGEEAEKNKLDHLFQHIYNNFISISSLQKNLAFFTNGYNILASIIGILFALPLYLAKKTQLGGLMQIAGAFGNVISAFSVFINSFYLLTQWRAVVHRLTELNQTMQNLQENKQKTAIILEKTTDFAVEIQNLQITSPQGAILLNDMNLTFEQGKSYLICGPSGLGKSTLFRAIAGAWYYGSGMIRIHQDALVLFLPQKPYLPSGSLQDILAYPNPNTFSDTQLQSILQQCLLDKYLTQLNTATNWSQILSLGEQQLLSFGRILLHKPDIIFMDEATSALDEAKEAHVYATIRNALPQTTIISVGHRSSLHQFHDEVIVLALPVLEQTQYPNLDGASATVLLS